MIRVSQLKLPVEHNEEQFCQKIEKSLKIKKDQIKKLQIVKNQLMQGRSRMSPLSTLQMYGLTMKRRF